MEAQQVELQAHFSTQDKTLEELSELLQELSAAHP
jgi:uncharacterized coiled-coil protein SlyX